MTDEGRRVLRPGHRIALGPDMYTVIQINGTAVTLQDERGDLSAMMLGYLLTAPGFEALDAVAPRRVPQDGRLSTLDQAEQGRLRWLEGHLIELETGRHPERPPRAEYDPGLYGTKEREQAKLAEFEAAGRPMTRRHLQRLRRAYREEGLIGLADRRKLRTVTPGGETDPRVVAVLGVDGDWTRRTASIRRFGTLPGAIREQAGWGRLLSDPEWGSPIPSHGTPSKIPFIDITDGDERSVA